MFDTVLVANRGEIACRVIRTARRMGIRTVAVYHPLEAGALHVAMADEAVCLPGSDPRGAYLDVAGVLGAARRCGAGAIHPGYGFLSENADFAEACAAAGVVFIGPPAAAMRAMGDKNGAKALMAASGVPLLPGYHGEDQADELLRAEALRVGFPLLIKASAGGGGKGMRVVERIEDFGEQLASCRREALASFGDARVLLERYLSRCRHVEIQVFADRHGGCVSLFERDCSVQRRHQKVIEEAPAPGLPPALQQAMGRAAVAAARAVDYVGAGTVEFLLAPDGGFHFMEMNTRLQVEHPVTEFITGLDLVEWQLRVAAGEPLPASWASLPCRGHAFELRLYAEDPERDFLPSPGRLEHLRMPETCAWLRLDTGVREGDEISPHFDPMIAKLVTWGESREQALARARQALAACEIGGVASNLELLRRVLACDDFAAARLHTGLIGEHRERLLAPVGRAPLEVLAAAAGACLLDEQAAATACAADPWSPWSARDGWRPGHRQRRRLEFDQGGDRRALWLEYGEGGWRLEADGQSLSLQASREGRHGLSLQLDGRRLQLQVLRMGGRFELLWRGQRWLLDYRDPLQRAVHAHDAQTELVAPMPGRVIAWLVQPGTAVAAGTPLLVLEAMKMEHSLRAPEAGVVEGFCAPVGGQVVAGQRLVDFVPEGSP